jgi:alpha-tubulin suppressor-like RCC1 family protein
VVFASDQRLALIGALRGAVQRMRAVRSLLRCDQLPAACESSMGYSARGPRVPSRMFAIRFKVATTVVSLCVGLGTSCQPSDNFDGGTDGGTARGWQSLAVGERHTCAGSATSVWCWGANESFQVAATAAPFLQPMRVSGAVGGTFAGRGHTCQVRLDGSAWCWGGNAQGQSGSDGAAALAPERVLDVGVVTMGSNGDHNCAVLNDGGVSCWGWNVFGQLGDGSTDAGGARPVLSPIAFSRVALGSFHTCGVSVAGEPWCWGRNTVGQLGIGSTLSPQEVVPHRVALSEVEAITAGRGHSCALTSAGEVHCWGRNVDGVLGLGSANDAQSPKRVPLPARASRISAREDQTCAIDEQNRLWCWGKNECQALSPDAGSVFSPVHVADDVREVGIGERHLCVVLLDGGLDCWGANDEGQVRLPISVCSPRVRLPLPR